MYIERRKADGEAGMWKVGWRSGEGRKVGRARVLYLDSR